MQASLEQGEGLLGAVQRCQSLFCVRKPAADPSKWVSTYRKKQVPARGAAALETPIPPPPHVGKRA